VGADLVKREAVEYLGYVETEERSVVIRGECVSEKVLRLSEELTKVKTLFDKEYFLLLSGISSLRIWSGLHSMYEMMIRTYFRMNLIYNNLKE
jgi:hypothetical protein